MKKNKLQESGFNSRLVSSFKKAGWGHKLPDPDQRAITSGGKRPFDGFAFFGDLGAVYFESKLIKNKLQAFSLSRLEEHQWKNLLELKSLGATALVILGYWVSRKEFGYFVFDVEFLWELFQFGKKSVLGKELKQLKEAGQYISFRETFTPRLLVERCITKLE